jgi:hypothetical protein
MRFLEKVRRVIDGETDCGESELKRVPPRESAQQFLVKVARMAVEEMKAEGFVLPGTNSGFVPKSYVIFLSSQNARVWHSEKSMAMLGWLKRILAEEAKKLTQCQAIDSSINVDLRVDATLNANEIRVQAFWQTPDAKDQLRTELKPSEAGIEDALVSNVRPLVVKGGR